MAKSPRPKDDGNPHVDGGNYHVQLGFEIYQIIGHRPDGKSEIADPMHIDDLERRAFVRAVFGYVEALTFTLKRLAHQRKPEAISVAELDFIEEREFKLEESGFVKERQAKIRLQSNVKFALRLLARINDEAEPDFSKKDPFWETFDRAIQVRDALMHPRHIDSLDVTDEQLKDVAETFRWFVRLYARHIGDNWVQVRDIIARLFQTGEAQQMLADFATQVGRIVRSVPEIASDILEKE